MFRLRTRPKAELLPRSGSVREETGEERERGRGERGRSDRNLLWVGSPQRCRSQRQMEASSHTAMRMLLSRLKLVCRMADMHLGRVSVVHLRIQNKMHLIDVVGVFLSANLTGGVS